MSERDGIGREEILKLGEVPCKNRVIFTSHRYDDIPYACYLPPYEGEKEVGYCRKGTRRRSVCPVPLVAETHRSDQGWPPLFLLDVHGNLCQQV